jgi:hypothetical protein
MKTLMLIAALGLAWHVPLHAEIKLNDQIYNQVFYTYFFNEKVNGIETSNYLNQVKHDKKLSEQVDGALYSFRKNSHFNLTKSAEENIKSEFLGFYAFLTFDQKRIANFFKRDDFSGQLIIDGGIAVLRQYQPFPDSEKAQDMKSAWLKNLKIDRQDFIKYLISVSVNRPLFTGKAGSPWGHYNEYHWNQALSIFQHYGQLNINCAPGKCKVKITAAGTDTTTTPDTLVVAMNGPRSVLTIEFMQKGFEIYKWIDTCYERKLLKINAKLKSKGKKGN